MIVNDFNENYSQGWIKIHKSIRKHWVFQDAQKFKWWIILLMEVNYEDKKYNLYNDLYTIKRGQCAYSLKTWSKRFNCSPKTVAKFFNMLEKDDMIIRKTIGKGNRTTTLINVTNYTQYQDTSNRKGTRKGTRTGTRKGPRKVPSTKEYKEIKNRFVKPTPKEVLHYMTEKGFPNQADRFCDFYEAKGWMIGKNKMKDWKSAVRNWNRKDTPSTNQPKIQL